MIDSFFTKNTNSGLLVTRIAIVGGVAVIIAFCTYLLLSGSTPPQKTIIKDLNVSKLIDEAK